MLNLKNLHLYIPNQAISVFVRYFLISNLKILVVKERNTKLGDFRYNRKTKFYRITVNNNLTPEAFVFILAHEIAHYETFVQFKGRVLPHGKEWKEIFKNFLIELLQKQVFSIELKQELEKYIQKPTSRIKLGSNIHKNLFPDKVSFTSKVPLSELTEGEKFYITDKNKVFIKGKKRRVRFFCLKADTLQQYVAMPYLLVTRFE